jgi:hypothetical protein
MDSQAPAALGASHTDPTRSKTSLSAKPAGLAVIKKGNVPRKTGAESAGTPGAPGEEGDGHPKDAYSPGGNKRSRARTLRADPTTLAPDEVVSLRRSGRIRAPTKNTSSEYKPRTTRTPKPTKATPSPTKSKKIDPEPVSSDSAMAESKPKAEPKRKAASKPKKPAAKDLWEPENARTHYSPFATRDLAVRVSAICAKE